MNTNHGILTIVKYQSLYHN